jgi:hypothetical protein
MCIQPADAVNIAGAGKILAARRPVASRQSRHDAKGKRKVNGRLTRSGVFGLGDDVGPMLDGLPRLADRLGEGVLFVEVFPLAAVIQLHQMTQGTAGPEQLPFGILALNFDGERLGHILILSWTCFGLGLRRCDCVSFQFQRKS